MPFTLIPEARLTEYNEKENDFFEFIDVIKKSEKKIKKYSSMIEKKRIESNKDLIKKCEEDISKEIKEIITFISDDNKIKNETKKFLAKIAYEYSKSFISFANTFELVKKGNSLQSLLEKYTYLFSGIKSDFSTEYCKKEAVKTFIFLCYRAKIRLLHLYDKESIENYLEFINNTIITTLKEKFGTILNDEELWTGALSNKSEDLNNMLKNKFLFY